MGDYSRDMRDRIMDAWWRVIDIKGSRRDEWMFALAVMNLY